MLELTSIDKKYGSHEVLRIRNFTLPPHISWLKGANGSGKTTLLKVIAGIIPFQGEILLDEKFSSNRSPVAYRQLVSFADAEPLYPAFITGRQLINLFAEVKKSPVGQLSSLCETFQVTSFLDQPIGTYSSGMTKRISLVTAFLGSPRVILLDEPLVTLDVASVDILLLKIKTATQSGTQFIITSHQPLYTQALPDITELHLKNQQLWR